ncbi:laccase-15-like [Triticum urartu]|nr:laccase-15-like [Triticum urartu]XP_048574285.1 laccase-15-like [Triticum urartu]
MGETVLLTCSPYYSEILALLLCSPKTALAASSLAAMGTVGVALFLPVALAATAGGGDAVIVEHTFVVSQIKLRRLCNDTLVTVVNGQLPGPAIEVTEGDSLVVHVINKSPSGLTIHWHGVKQQLNCWADGAGMITQCPIQPNKNFTYRFNVKGQEGTLWWHAHVGCLRATIHGALLIRPRSGPNSYPFPRPNKEIPIVIGEWLGMDPIELETRIQRSILSDEPLSATINGKLGDANNCSGVIEDNYILNVEQGKTYLLRIVNAALHSEYYVKIAGHTFTVVAADANYVKPYNTDTIAIAPGETVDALLVADASPGRYYIVANSKSMKVKTRGIVHYNPSKRYDDTPVMAPDMPGKNDAVASFYFHGNLTSLPHPLAHPVPANVDEQLFMAIDTTHMCREGGSVCGLVSRMNNISFQLPSRTPLLKAHYYHNVSSSVSTLQEFPSSIPPGLVYDEGQTSKATSVRRLRYNTTVEIVFRCPPVMYSYSNPMHLHGHDFFVLAQGHGKYDAQKDVQTYNLVDPPVRNTILVPVVGWTAIRFVASNPGVWFLHCHYEKHASSGMAMAFMVENGPTLDSTLPPPPSDYPSCDDQNSGLAFD